ncbi:unnamed protein product [Arctogadus glacialis]
MTRSQPRPEDTPGPRGRSLSPWVLSPRRTDPTGPSVLGPPWEWEQTSKPPEGGQGRLLTSGAAESVLTEDEEASDKPDGSSHLEIEEKRDDNIINPRRTLEVVEAHRRTQALPWSLPNSHRKWSIKMGCCSTSPHCLDEGDLFLEPFCRGSSELGLNNKRKT